MHVNMMFWPENYSILFLNIKTRLTRNKILIIF